MVHRYKYVNTKVGQCTRGRSTELTYQSAGQYKKDRLILTLIQGYMQYNDSNTHFL